MTKFVVRLIGLSVFLLVIGLTRALACSCAAPPTVPDAFAKSKNVLTARIVGGESIIRPDGTIDRYLRRAVLMEVEKVYKGNLGVQETIKVFDGGGGDCTAGFQRNAVGDRFLMFIGEPGFGGQPELYSVSLCGRTRPLELAAPDLVYLDNRATLEGKTRLSGTIRAGGENTPIPSAANLKVTVTGKRFSKELETDAQGFFDIWDIPPGVYTVKYQLPAGWKFSDFRLSSPQGRTGWIKTSDAAFQVEIVAKKHTEFASLIVIDNSIAGRVLSPTGKPMQDVCVSAYWLTPTSNIFRIPDDCTDENGKFSIEELPPGRYRIHINSRGRITSSMPFEEFYYPGTSKKEEAVPVMVGEGLSTRDLVITVKETVPLIRVSGIVKLEDGSPNGGTEVEFIPNDQERYETVKKNTDTAGRFSFELPQGSAGRLRAEVNIYESRFDKCPGIVSLRRFRTRNRVQSTFDLVVDGTASVSDIRLIIHLSCSTK